MSFKSAVLAAAALAVPATLAHAQSQTQTGPAQAPSPAPAQARPGQAGAPTDVQGVTVTGQSQGIRTSVDRLSYSVSGDLQTTTGSAADALRNVPGVEVDPQGNVSLRGDSNVTILVDGRPSALFRGEGRADALQQLGADTIDRVEVITNPSAALSPEGTGGVINLVTKKTRRAGKTGSIRGSVGTEGRANASVSGAYSGQKLTVSANAGYRKQGGEFTDERIRERLDPADGDVIETSRWLTRSNQEGGGFANGRIGIDYDPNPRDRFSLEGNLFSFGLKPDGLTSFEVRNQADVVQRATNRIFDNEFGNQNKSLRGSWRRRYGEEHELTLDLTWDMFDNFNDNRIREVSLVPLRPDAFEANRNEIDRDEHRAKLEYGRPYGDRRKFRVGYEGALTEVDFDTLRRRGASPETLAVDPTFSNRFAYEQDVHALYGTYERPFGAKLIAQFGLRLEQVDTVANLLTPPPPNFPVQARETNDYFRAYPTLNLGYDLDDARRIRAGYSRRVQRPQPFDLNPFPIFIDEQTVRTGNPRLEPEITDSFEAAFQYRRQATFYLATLFYRQASGGITDVLLQRPGGGFELTRANLAESRRAGLELTANGRLTPKLSYNVSATLGWVEIEPTPLGGSTESRSGATLSGRMNVNWNPTANDFFQINGFMNGEQLLAQGYREATGMLNLGYRRKVNEQLSLVLTAQNVLDTFKQRTRIDTQVFRERVEQNFLSPTLFGGFIYTFGGANQNNRRGRPEPTFEYEQGGGAAPPT